MAAPLIAPVNTGKIRRIRRLEVVGAQLKVFCLLLLFALLVTACTLAGSGEERTTATPPALSPPPATDRPPANATETTQPIPTPTLLPTATVVATATAMPTATATPSPTLAVVTETPAAIPADLGIRREKVFIYPVPQLYAGDLATLQLIADVPANIGPNDVDVHIFVGDTLLVDATLNWRNLGGDVVGLYTWVWDTTGQAGDHDITIVLDPHDKIEAGDENPDNNRLTFTVTVAPATALPPLEVDQVWLTVQNDCCQIHVASNTAAHRDLEPLAAMVDAAFEEASAQIEETTEGRYDVFLIDRVIGQGGYAGASMVISYLDRDYAGTGLYEVLVHEAVHLIDRQFAPRRISFLAEGVAVWATGGHYKPEDVNRRAAALLEGDLYIPLPGEFINDFYNMQHEIAYLQAASFVSYLIDSYGWPRVRAFYADVTPDSAPTLTEAVDANLQRHFGRSLAETESDWLAYLKQLPRDRNALPDLVTTIRFYEVMRYYQQMYDPTAHFLIAWLPAPEEVQQRGNTADLNRKPRDEINVVLETMLQAANQALLDGEYNRANGILDSVVRVLDNNGAFIDPLAIHYRAIVRTAAAQGYEIQQLTLRGSQASALATTGRSIHLRELNFTLDNQSWTLSR
jgi:hypothetical protein